MRPAALLVLLLAGCGRSEPRSGSNCPHDLGFDRSGLVRVHAKIPPAVLRRDMSLAEIMAEARGSTGGAKAQGLTEVEHQLAFRTLVNSETTRGRTCVWFDEVTVDMAPRSVQIFVPREYPDDSCEYRAILAHEREHERVHAERLTEAAARVEAALTAARWLPARGNPLEAADRASAEAALNEKIRKVVAPVYASYKEELSAAQAELDRPDLYQWVSKRCAGWK
jgi:hypothetical protein